MLDTRNHVIINITMKHLSTLLYLLQSVLYCLVSNVCTQGDELSVLIRVLNSTCIINGRNECRNKYLQICFKNKQQCGRKMTADCFIQSYDDLNKADLKALAGSNLKHITLAKISSIKNIIVGITEEPKTQPFPLATSCETNRTNTTNGFRVKTSSADGNYQFILSIDVVCKNSSFCGINCVICAQKTTLSTGIVTTSDNGKSTIISLLTTFNISRSTIKTTLRTLYTTSRLTTTVTDGSNTARFKTNKASSVLTDLLLPITTTEGYSTNTYNGTIQTTNRIIKSVNSSEHSQNITVIVVPIAIILGTSVVVILIYVCYRKHNQKSKTTPAEDEKNRLVVNDDTEGDDRNFSTDRSNSVQKNMVNLQIEKALKEEDMVHAKPENVDETVSCRVDESESISTKHNHTTEIHSKEVNSELEDNEVINKITENQADTEQSNNGMEPVNSAHTDTDDKTTQRHKKKKKKKRADTEENTSSTSAGVSERSFSANKNNDIANGQNNGYVPDDEHSDAALPYESDEQGERKSSSEIAMSSPLDNKNIDSQEIEYKSKSNSQNEDIKLSKSMQNEDISNEGQNNRAKSNSEDVSGNDVPSSDTGAVHHQAQSSGGFPHQEISRNDIENIAQAKVETLIHGKVSEMRRDMTEHTNNTINQLKEEVSAFQQDITEKMLQQSNKFKEQMNKNTEDLEKAERKRQRKMQKLKDQIEECTERLQIFEDRNDEYIQNQKLFEDKVAASSGNQDNARREITENKKEIQRLRDEMNRLSENLRQQISQQRGVISVPDTPLFTRTTHVSESSPHSRVDTNGLLRSRTASDDALYSRHGGSWPTTDQYSELEKKRKRKKKKRTPSIHFPGDGTVHIQHEDNTIDIEQIGPMEVQQVNRGIRLTGGNVEIDIKSPRKKTISLKPQKDQST